MSGLRHKVAVAAAAGVGLATAHLFLGVYTPPAAAAGPGSESLLYYYFVVGPLAGLLYYYVVAATLERTALWVAVCGLGAYVFSAWFARPMLYERLNAALVEPGGAAVAVEREDWLKALIAAGRYGTPGLSPPMLDVRSSDTGTVPVRNIGAGPIVLSVAVVAADAAASGGWRGCGFTGYAGEGPQEWVELDPGESALFDLDPVCKEIFLELESHTEFRVGNESVAVDAGWWTTSALVAPNGRAAERASGNAGLPWSYDARAFYAAARRED